MIRNKKNLLKAISIITLSSALFTISPVSAHAAWKQNSTGWWFTEGSSYATGWRQINGAWYFFDNNGYMKTGWLNDKGTWYYLENSGAMKTGWAQIKSVWYFFNNSGAMQTGWLKSGSTWYYLDNSGAMQTGWIVVNEKSYYLDNSGAMKTGWVTLDKNNKAYFNADGSQPAGWFELNGKTYYSVEQSGITYNDVRDGYYIDDNGVRQKKIKFEDSDDMLNAIQKEDSEFLSKKKSETPDYKLSVGSGLSPSIWFADDFGIESEPCFNFMYTSETEEIASYNYFVGLYSGKIYVAPGSYGRMYEIKDNKKVKTYDGKQILDPSSLKDWR